MHCRLAGCRGAAARLALLFALLALCLGVNATAPALPGYRLAAQDLHASVKKGALRWHAKAQRGAEGALRRSHGSELFAEREANELAIEKARLTGTRPAYKLTFWGCMVAGALSRSVAQVALHPFNVLKTLLQTKGSFAAVLPLTVADLTRGAGAQFLLSVPTGAFHYAVLEATKHAMTDVFPATSASATAVFDFISSSAATTFSSVLSTPTMVLTSRIMAGSYPNLLSGIGSICKESGLRGFYAGWLPGLVQKIPSYGLTWVFFQQAKDLHFRFFKHEPSDGENFWLGAIAAAGSVTVMIPMDTVKTRLVTQTAGSARHYRGIIDCFRTIARTEGVGAFYNSLTPRLASVVPMIGIQYGILCLLTRKMAEGSIGEGARRAQEAAARAAALGGPAASPESPLEVAEESTTYT
ncbi:mitochondrial carrier domain-containing protein [Tribonema minus]|uniref:Mitochondrial carrier domain-containing protein n=1 Tax=Tribonema minus TaxID=303371 RepID=A0A835ZCC4_9STRA|nr:mitochondrial carrier domain-containing protein [Tribonema minus]